MQKFSILYFSLSDSFKHNYLPFVLVLILLLISCKSDSNTSVIASKVPKFEISTILEDSISIRALDHKNNRYWFAGSQGKYGFINQSSNVVTQFQIEIENDLELRSLAVTSNYTYMLTAGNPALVYKVSHENESVQLVYTEHGKSVFYDSMKFWNDKEGIAMGDPQNGCFSIIKTIDGGDSWQKVKCEKMPPAMPGEAAFAASNSNLKIHNDHVWFITGGKYARVFYSDSKGRSWKAIETPITSGEEMTGIYAIDFYNKDLGIIIGGDWNNKKINTNNKAISKNGGKTWQLISQNSGPGYCSDIIIIPETQEKEIMAVGSSGVWWSGDQGDNWTKLSDKGFYTLKMINANEGFLAGKNKISSLVLKR